MTSSNEQRVSVHTEVDAPAERVFALVTDPKGHVAVDGSGMLVAAHDAEPVTAVGDTFGMDMDREPLGDLPMGKYTVLNTVTRYEPDRLFEWTIGMPGRSPIGHVYGYELESLSAGRTRVTSYCDWSGLHPKLRDRVTFPVVPAEMMQATLERLNAVLEEDRTTTDRG
jgi:uncharacterized protein YndB with AHSA1/START domain